MNPLLIYFFYSERHFKCHVEVRGGWVRFFSSLAGMPSTYGGRKGTTQLLLLCGLLLLSIAARPGQARPSPEEYAAAPAGNMIFSHNADYRQVDRQTEFRKKFENLP